MASSAVKIDWLTITGKGYNEEIIGGHLNGHTAEMFAKDRMSWLLQDFQALEAKTGNGFYPYVFKDLVSGCTLAVSDKLDTQGWKFEMTGSSPLTAKQRQDILARAVQSGATVTRIDVAWDVMNSDITPLGIMTLYELSEHSRRQLKTQYVKSIKGDTFYIGSRQSAYFLRIYDKAKEQAVEHEWVRVEIEIKEHAAAHWASFLAKDPSVIAPEVRRMIDLPGSGIDTILSLWESGVDIPRAITPYTAPDTEVWFRETVEPAFRRLVHENRDVAERILQGLQGYFFEGWSYDTVNGLLKENE